MFQKLLSFIFLVNQVLGRILAQVGARFKLARLRHQGALIGKNVELRGHCIITLERGGFLEIGDDVVIDQGAELIIHSGGRLLIGARVYIGKRDLISVKTQVTIGDHCIFAHQVTIIDSHHSYDDYQTPIRDQKETSHPIHISQNVWLGTGVVIVKGIELGDHTVVGANSVVTHSFGPRAVIGGVPAHCI